MYIHTLYDNFAYVLLLVVHISVTTMITMFHSCNLLNLTVCMWRYTRIYKCETQNGLLWPFKQYLLFLFIHLLANLIIGLNTITILSCLFVFCSSHDSFFSFLIFSRCLNEFREKPANESKTFAKPNFSYLFSDSQFGRHVNYTILCSFYSIISYLCFYLVFGVIFAGL